MYFKYFLLQINCEKKASSGDLTFRYSQKVFSNVINTLEINFDTDEEETVGRSIDVPWRYPDDEVQDGSTSLPSFNYANFNFETEEL